MSKDRLSLEVFRDSNDYAPENTPINALLLGVRGLEKLVGRLDIIATDSTFPLPCVRSERIDLLEMPTTPLRADLNIFASRKPIYIPGQWGPTAVSTVTPNDTPLGMRIGIIPPTHSHTEHITTHELLHMINTKTEGKAFDGDAHCTDTCCILHATGYATEICDECRDQATTNYKNLVDAKIGKSVPKNILFPKQFDELSAHETSE